MREYDSGTLSSKASKASRLSAVLVCVHFEFCFATAGATATATATACAAGDELPPAVTTARCPNVPNNQFCEKEAALMERASSGFILWSCLRLQAGKQAASSSPLFVTFFPLILRHNHQ